MTNELEKKFFDTFGIEPSTKYDYCWKSEENKDKLYPPITDHILLELMCILSEWRQYCVSYYIIDAININTLKSDILRDCLCMSHWYEFNKCGKDIKQQVRILFEEVGNEN